jgi:hypothetical protein
MNQKGQKSIPPEAGATNEIKITLLLLLIQEALNLVKQQRRKQAKAKAATQRPTSNDLVYSTAISTIKAPLYT